MTKRIAEPIWDEVSGFVHAFEDAWQGDGDQRLESFLPPADSPLYLEVLCELIRVELERKWEHGTDVTLSSYMERFPRLREAKRQLSEIAYEEYRLRRQSGGDVTPQWYADQYDVDVGHWPQILGDDAQPLRPSVSCHSASFWRQLHAEEPELAARYAEIHDAMPVVGTEFHDFCVLAELGRGAIARVYLAEQLGLANRIVVLKISSEFTHESHKLAQLQHTNIMPVYSVHRSGPLCAICMPYLGTTTLADLLQELRGSPQLPTTGNLVVSTVEAARCQSDSILAQVSNQRGRGVDLTHEFSSLRSRGYEECVLWIFRQIARGLAHAHRRGIVHCDLKPANILFRNDGNPVLLDFNLSGQWHSNAIALTTAVGGTLPYMAPEHLATLVHGNQLVSPRIDIYSLGVVLYEVLTTKLPHPLPTVINESEISQMISVRQKQPPSARSANPHVSPGLDAILRKCLQPDADGRYRSAEELADDMDRQLNARPLRFAPNSSTSERLLKWSRRHPRLSSASSMFGVAALIVVTLLIVLGQWRDRVLRHESTDAMTTLERLSIDASLRMHSFSRADRIESGLEIASAALTTYGVFEDPRWRDGPLVQHVSARDRERLMRRIGETLILCASAQLVRVRNGSPADVTEVLQDARRLNELAASCYSEPHVPRSLLLQKAEIADRLGRADEARQYRADAKQREPVSAWDKYLIAQDLANQGQYEQAARLLDSAIEQEPRRVVFWCLLGACRYELEQFTDALVCYAVCHTLTPESAMLCFNRGLCHMRRGEYDRAMRQFGAAIEIDDQCVDAYFQRASAHERQQDYLAAIADLDRAVALAPERSQFLFARAKIKREHGGDAAGAKADRDLALSIEPADPASWLSRALAHQHDGRVEEALSDLDHAMRWPRYRGHARYEKAVILMIELNQPDEALAVLDELIADEPDHVRGLMVRGALLAEKGQRDLAHRDAQKCLRLSQRGVTFFNVGCIYAITSKEGNGDKEVALRNLLQAARHGVSRKYPSADSHLDSIRDDPGFQRLLRDWDRYASRIDKP